MVVVVVEEDVLLQRVSVRGVLRRCPKSVAADPCRGVLVLQW